jgi:two-component system, LytTR family, sensor kinase
MQTTEQGFIFRDLPVLLIGIPVVAIAGVLLFGSQFFDEEGTKLIIAAFGSLLSTLIIWLGVRKIVIYLWRRHPWEKDPVKHLIIEIGAILGYTSLAGAFLYSFWFVFNPEFLEVQNFGVNIFFTLLITFFITSLHEGWFFFQQWKKTLVLSEMLAKENLQSQFETLKSQISPHFLFNNLNTLAELIEEDQKTAVEYVQRTADYYRKILSLRDKDVMPLAEELKLIDDFYFLQRKRYGKNLSLSVNISETHNETYVAPLAIQMLIENAIKHNIISGDKPLMISVRSDDEYIVVENNLQLREADPGSGRLGLQNISNRYRFLSNRDIIVSSDKGVFTVSIPVLRMQI